MKLYMKRSFNAVMAFGLVFAAGAMFTGCDPDYSDRYPEEYAKVVRIKDPGRQNVTVYN